MALFINHINTVLGKLRETPITALSTDPTTEAYRAAEAVRRAITRVWNAKQWSFKVRSRSLALVAGTSAYALPPDVGEIFIVKSSSEPYTIPVLSESAMDQYDPQQTLTGMPQAVRLFDMSGALAQPASAAVVTVTSSSASDATQKVVVKGLVGGVVQVEELSLAGTGNVSGTKLFSEVQAITKSDDTVGFVTVTSGAVTLAVMAPAESVHRRRFLRVYPTPDTSYTLTLKHFAYPPTITSAYEDSEIPTKWDYVVDQFAFALALQSKGKEQAEEFASQFQVAGKFLETDMKGEEYVASQDIVIPGDITEGGSHTWKNMPAGWYPTLS